MILALTVVLPVCAQPRKATVPIPPANLAMHTQMVVPSVVPGPSREKLQNLAKSRFPRSHYELGMYLKEHDAVDAALVEFLKATQDNPKDTKAFYEQAVIFQSSGFLKLAESALQQAIGSDTDVKHNWQARILLATVRVQQGNLEQALGELSEILGITPPKALPYKVVRTEKEAQHDDTEQLLSSIPVMQMPHGALPVPVVEAVSEAVLEPPPSSEILRGLTSADLVSPKKSTRTVVTHHSHDEAGKMIADASSSYTEDAVERILAETRAEAKRAQEQKSGGFMSFFKREPEQKHEDDPVAARQKAVDQVIREQAAKLNERLARHQVPEAQPAKRRRSFMGGLLAWRNSEPQPETETKVVVKPSSMPDVALSAHRSLPAETTYSSVSSQPKILPAETPTKVTRVEAAPVVPAYTPPPVVQPKQVAKSTGTRPKKSPVSQPGSLALSYHQQRTAEQEAQYESELNKIHKSSDPWTMRLTYLAKHGTSTLKEGEAFMMSEETGEATLFLTDGQVITRHIGDSHQAEDVALMRRPDVMMPEDNTYNISLLGKILPKSGAKKQAVKPADDPMGGFVKGVRGVFGL